MKTRTQAKLSHRKGTRKAQLANMRAARNALRLSGQVDSQGPEEIPSTSSSPLLVHQIEPLSGPASVASTRKIGYFTSVNDDVTDRQLPVTIVDLNCLASLLTQVLCQICQQPGLTLQEGSGSKAFAIHLSLYCPTCEQVISEGYTSPRNSKCQEINRKVVASSVSVGMGCSSLARFCEGLGIRCMFPQSFNLHMNAIYHTTKELAQKYFHQSRNVVIQFHKDHNPDAFKSDGVLEIAVSYDGTWMKRGHTSKFGCCAVIEVETGLVIDFHVMSLYCQVCKTTGAKIQARDSQLHDQWLRDHKASGQCTQNYVGSSGGMEVAGAIELWGRSQDHGMRYTTLLGDGDTKAFLSLTKSQPYTDVVIKKEECVNHIAKRLGSSLRNLKTNLSKQKVRIGGKVKGSLTDSKINLLQSYYTKAVRSSNSSVEAMASAIWAGYYHSISTDQKPQHDYCPQGAQSWCWFNREKADGVPRPSRPTDKQSTFLNEKVAEHVKVVYERLSNPELLNRCLLGRTQNPNECLHSLIWSRCPKHLWSGYKRIYIATTLAVGEFNMGATAFQQYLDSLGFSVSNTSKVLGTLRDRKRVRSAEHSASISQKRLRQCKNLAEARYHSDSVRGEDGPSYGAGLF